jgi:hypothetical protein
VRAGDRYSPTRWPRSTSLRDFRTSEVHPIDPGLLDLLHGLTDLTGSRQPFQVISGYRSPATNLMLRHRSEGVASGSLHMKGQAIDIRLPISRCRSCRAALAAGRGGVGYIHLELARIRGGQALRKARPSALPYSSAPGGDALSSSASKK